MQVEDGRRPDGRRSHICDEFMSVSGAETFVFIVAECPEETSKCCLDFAVLLVGGMRVPTHIGSREKGECHRLGIVVGG
ncbi:hypothetical protein ACLKA6_008424 [Drosophila palustris]